MRNSGMPLPMFSMMMCATSDGAAIEEGSISCGMDAEMTSVLPSASTVL